MSRTCEVAPGHFAHATGALWMPGASTVLVADAHLGYGWAQRRRGELGPVRDDLAPKKLEALIDELAPRELVFLGDTVHAPRPGPEERNLIEGVLTSLGQRLKLTLLRGNHDRGFERDFARLDIPLLDEWRFEQTRAVHGDRSSAPESGTTVLGHLHPSIEIEDAAGARQRLPAFLIATNVIVLPAFSPFAAGIDIARSAVLPAGKLEAIAATGTRVVRLGPLRQGRLELSRTVKTGRASDWR